MNNRPKILPASADDLDQVLVFLESDPGHEYQQSPAERSRQVQLAVEDCSLFTAIGSNGITAMALLDIQRAQVSYFFVSPGTRKEQLARQLMMTAEKAIVQFGHTSLDVRVTESTRPMLIRCGYARKNRAGTCADADNSPDLVSRQFPRRKTRFLRQVENWFSKLGIPADYGRQRRLRLQEEPPELRSIGKDIFDREQFLRPAAARAWTVMQSKASSEDITLGLVSAFRSVEYQAGLVERKKLRGIEMNDILAVSAAPGFSEHHSGRAVDLTTPGLKPLEDEFEKSDAFAWLSENAKSFGFRMSYPRHNRHGILYEPWHWYYFR